MKRHVIFTLIALAMLVQSAFAQGPPWASNGQSWVPCTTCSATGGTPGTGINVPAPTGSQPATLLYLGLGYGDGTEPMPMNGTGFGSPWQ